MSDLIDVPTRSYTFIGLGTNVQGTITFKGDTKVAGNLKGEIRMQGESPLSVEPTGHINGTIYCDNLFVYGSIEGDIRATGRVVIYPSANVQGQVQAESLVIHPGSVVNMDGRTEERFPTQ